MNASHSNDLKPIKLCKATLRVPLKKQRLAQLFTALLFVQKAPSSISRCDPKSLFWLFSFTAVSDNTRPAVSKTSLDFGFNHLSGPHRKQVYFSGFKMRISICFVCFKFSCFWTSEFACLQVLALKSFRNMASLDSQGEIVPIELPNPAWTQIWEGENESFVPANI